MVFLAAAVVLIGMLCLLNLLLTFGVIRRLREQSATGKAPTPILDPDGKPALVGDVPPAGAPIGDFTATTVDGDLISREGLVNGGTAVFLAADCGSCRENVPNLVIDGRLADPADLVEEFAPLARVVVETRGAGVAEAFGVSAIPAFCVFSEGTVRSASLDLSQLPQTAAA
jgi:hypothetical protein